jgi:DHA2 family multidrug resistance protein-like MFS transporter
MGLAAVALGMLTQVGGPAGLAIVVAASVVISLALSPVFNLTTELIVGSAPPVFRPRRPRPRSTRWAVR